MEVFLLKSPSLFPNRVSLFLVMRNPLSIFPNWTCVNDLMRYSLFVAEWFFINEFGYLFFVGLFL